MRLNIHKWIGNLFILSIPIILQIPNLYAQDAGAEKKLEDFHNKVLEMHHEEFNKVDKESLKQTLKGQYVNLLNELPPVSLSTTENIEFADEGRTNKKIDRLLKRQSRNNTLTIQNSLFNLGYNLVHDALEYTVLKAIYNSTVGEGWINRNGWDMELEPSTVTIGQLAEWYGIKTKNGDITEINLRDNNLQNVISPLIELLTQLERLEFYNNNMTAVQSTIGNLPKLTYLSYYANKITEIPVGLCNSISLKRIHFNQNLITDVPSAIENLTSLEAFYITGNRIRKLPPEFGNLSHLKVLSMTSNPIRTLPPEFGNLTSLTALQAVSNGLTELPIEFFNLVNLRDLYLMGNDLTVIPNDLRRLSKLRYLYLDNNEVTTFPNNLSGMDMLQIVSIPFNRLSTVPDGIADLSGLRSLYLNYNELTNADIDYSDLTSLTRLYIYGNNLTNLPLSMADLPSIQVIEAGLNQIREIPESLANITTLNTLDLRINHLTFDQLEPFFSAPTTPRIRSFRYLPQSSEFRLDLIVSGNELSIAQGGANGIYKWYKNGNLIASQTSKVLIPNLVNYSSMDNYHCVVSNSWIDNLELSSENGNVNPSIFYAVADGNWMDRIWVFHPSGSPLEMGQYPREGNEVFINSYQVTLSNNLSTNSVHVIVENNSASLTVDGAQLNIHGNIDLTKRREGFPGSVKIINGGKVTPTNN